MRCSCQRCGTYMVQEERGMESRCICPNCVNTCSACMGRVGEPQSLQSLRFTALMRERQGDGHTDDEDDIGP